MNIDFKLPELGENIENGDIVNILVREGDAIAANDGVFELETDKAVVEIPCPYGGKVAKIHVTKGQTVKGGQTLLTVETEAEAAAAQPPVKPSAPAATPAPKAEKPTIAASGATAGLSASGATAGLSSSAVPPTADVIPAGPAAPGATAGLSSSGATAGLSSSAVRPTADVIPAGPAARRMAREFGVNLGQIAGSGNRGRITPEDVKAATTAQAEPAFAQVGPQRVVPPGELGADVWGQVRREKMPKIRRTIAAQMAKSATIIPHVTNFDDADITDLEHLRQDVPQGYIGAGIKLTVMPFVLKAVAMSLQQHPALNASIDDEKEEVIYKQYINIGIAVDTPRGLVVPALRKVDKLGIPQIAQQLTTLAQKVRSAAFSVDDLRGGTFTISNMGAVGGMYSTPIINHPEVAILLLGRSRWAPIVRGEKIEVRLILPLSLNNQ